MQLISRIQRSPGDDMWMVRATLTRQTAGDRGDIERYTAVDLDPDDVTPGVFPMGYEHGRLTRSTGATWSVDRDRIEAWNDDDARRVASSVYDAARGFLELHLPPMTTTPPFTTPDLLRLEIGDDAWVWPVDAAPAQARAVLEAARHVRDGAAAVAQVR